MAATFATSAASSSTNSVTATPPANSKHAAKSRHSNAINSNEAKINGLLLYTAVKTPPKAASHPQATAQFGVDQLVWAKIDMHPWWPCKVSREDQRDPSSLYVKLEEGRNNKLAYFVEFCGPCTDRVWTAEANLFAYDGIESFKTYAQDQVDRAPTKLAKEKLAERFQLKVAVTRREQWERAIEEADLYLETNRKYITMLGESNSADTAVAHKKKVNNYSHRNNGLHVLMGQKCMLICYLYANR